MPRGRPALAPGTYGKITIYGDRQPYVARTRYCDLDGTRARSNAQARRNPLQSARSRMRCGNA